MTIFNPAGNNRALTLNGTTSVSGALTVPTGAGGHCYAVSNTDTASVAFIRFGASGLTAVATDFPVPAGQTLGIEAGAGSTHVAVVAPGAATGIVYVTPIRADSRR
jgi:hypothetical protein